MKKVQIIILSIIMIVSNLLSLSPNIIFANKTESNNNFLDSVSISHTNGSTDNTYEIWETVKVNYKWSLKEQKKGDIIRFSLPKELQLSNNIELNLETDDNIVIGNVTALKDGTVTVNLSDPTNYIENHININGNISFEVKFNRKFVIIGETNVIEFKLNNKVEKIEVNIKDEKAPSTEEILTKWGKINKEDEHIKWTIRVNYAKKKINNMKLTENLGKGHELVKGSIRIIEAEFDYNTGEAIKETDVTKNFTINERNDGFSIDFKNTDKSYYVRFMSKITDNSALQYENTVGISGDNNINKVITVEEKVQTGDANANGTTRKVSIGVTKQWIGPEKDSVTIKLLANGKETGKNAILNKTNGWQYTFENLEKYKDGHEIQYSVKEVNVDGYKSEISGNMKDGFVIKNTNISTISIPVLKKWIGNPTDSVTITLLADGIEKQQIKLNEKNGWKYIFENLLKYDQNDGHEIQYSIKETPINGYDSTITGDMNNGFIVTNTITGNVSIGNESENIENIPKTGDISILSYVGMGVLSLGAMILINKKK